MAVGAFVGRLIGGQVARYIRPNELADTAVTLKEREDVAHEEFKKATRLETRGQYKEAIAAHERLIARFGDTKIALDSKSCIDALYKRMAAD